MIILKIGKKIFNTCNCIAIIIFYAIFFFFFYLIADFAEELIVHAIIPHMLD